MEFRDVIAKFTRAADDVYSLDVEGEARPLGVTGEHPFFVRTYRARDSLISPDDDGEWKETRNLRSGDEIRLASGRWARVSSVRFKGSGVVYNFTVEGNHNYFVGGSGLLTHNACNPFDPRIQSNPLKGRFDDAFDGTTGFDDALKSARSNAGNLGKDTLKMYDPKTGTLIGEQSLNKKNGWRIDNDHVNWWDWSGGKKGTGGSFGHSFYPPAQTGPHSQYIGYASWQ